MSRAVDARRVEEGRDLLNERIGELYIELETEGNRFRQHEKEGEITGLEVGAAQMNIALRGAQGYGGKTDVEFLRPGAEFHSPFPDEARRDGAEVRRWRVVAVFEDRVVARLTDGLFTAERDFRNGATVPVIEE